jgi:signal transduction histidine kinase
VLSNLIGNAIDATKAAGGRLLLRTRNATDWQTGRSGVVFTVADTGSGMSPRTIFRIFEPFFTTKEVGGTGLGLWICREIVDRHHGSLRVRSSESPARSGTVFTLFLPFGDKPRD